MALSSALDVGSWERELDRRRVLVIDRTSPVAVKRDTRSLLVSADAGTFARAFAGVMAEPDARFGLIRVMRKRSRQGLPFELGERFQGRFSTRLLLKDEAQRSLVLGPVVSLGEWSAAAPAGRPLRVLLRHAENLLTSDFGEIVELETEQLPARVRYVYLEGSYIAGSCSFVVEPVAEQRCRVVCTWEYQEVRTPYVLWIGTSVLKMHLAVVHSQVAAGAARSGGRILRSDIPPEYVGAELLAGRPPGYAYSPWLAS